MNRLQNARARMQHRGEVRRGKFRPNKDGRAYMIYQWWRTNAKNPPKIVGKCKFHTIVALWAPLMWLRLFITASFKKDSVRAVSVLAVIALITVLSLTVSSILPVLMGLGIAVIGVAYCLGGAIFTWLLGSRIINGQWSAEVPRADDPEATRMFLMIALGVIFVPFTAIVYAAWLGKRIGSNLVIVVASGLMLLFWLTQYGFSLYRHFAQTLIATGFVVVTVALVGGTVLAVKHFWYKPRQQRLANEKLQAEREFRLSFYRQDRKYDEAFRLMFAFHYPDKTDDESAFETWREDYIRQIEDSSFDPEYNTYGLPNTESLPTEIRWEVDACLVGGRLGYYLATHAATATVRPPMRYPVRAFFREFKNFVGFIVDMFQTWRMGYCPIMDESEPPQAEASQV